MDGITFNMDGPNICGAWVNPKTGDAFIARDNFIQDNQFIIVTTDNRQLDLNYIQNYVKLEKKQNETDEQAIAAFKKNYSQNQPTSNSNSLDVPDDIMKMLETPTKSTNINEAQSSQINNYEDLMCPDDINMLNHVTAAPSQPTQQASQKILGQKQPTIAQPITPQINEIDNEDLLFIKRALRASDKPNISAVITWPQYPTKKIDILTNVLGVDINSIVEWFIRDINIDEIKDALKQSIIDYINNKDQKDQIINDNPHPEVKKTNIRRGRKSTNI